MIKRNILALTLVVVAVLGTSFGFYFYQIIYSPNFLIGQQDRLLYIATGSTFSDVQKQVKEQQFVNNLIAFSFVSKLMKYDELVKPGCYIIHADESNREVIRRLRAGEQTPVQITFNNVRLLSELSEKICANIELPTSEFDKLITSKEVIEKYGFKRATFPAMFIPNTYEVYWTIGAEELLDRMHVEYENFWNKDRSSKAEKIGLSKLEVSTLASIVQAESAHNDESPTIAGLYINRLQRGMLLQADPTVVYGVGDFTITRVLNVHKQTDSPYNTYMHAGLPPGPINFPSIISLDAVLDFKDHNYIYMCAKEDFSGYHNFSTNLRTHNAYAKKYQNALNKAGIFN